MQYQSSPLYPLFGLMGKTSSHPLQITINPTSFNGILLSNMQKNPKQSKLEKKLSHDTIGLLFLYPFIPFIKPIIIFYQIARSTSSPHAS